MGCCRGRANFAQLGPLGYILLGLRKATIVIVVFIAFVAFSIAVFAMGGLAAKYEWRPYDSVHKVADRHLRAIESVSRGRPSNESLRTTHYYRLRLTSSQTGEDRQPDRVSFTPLSDGYLIARRGGGLYFAERSLKPESKSQPIRTRVPTNKDEFIRENPDRPTTRQPLVQFGVKDILLRRRGKGIELFATYSVWHSEDRCFTLRVSKLRSTKDALLGGDPGVWSTLLDTEPCLPLASPDVDPYGEWTFLQAGGRMAFLGPNQLLVTVGDHWRDGLRSPDLPQDPSSHLGKTILIDLSSGASRVYTKGHRNPQGLYVDRQGKIFSLEHGPRGGDELNQLIDGRNYGWPKVSFGLQYRHLPHWPAPHWGEHRGFELPIYSWIPSIGTSNLVRIEGNTRFPKWRGDLIVASLSNVALHRVRLREGRAIIVERIEIGNRIRDFEAADDGSLVLLMEPGDLITVVPLEASDVAEITDPLVRGELLWAQCSGCHALDPTEGVRQGPHLQGIVGRTVASQPGYEYSQVLQGMDARWTEETLDAYLRDPQAFAPGNTMQFSGVKDPVDRAAIISYLSTK